MNCETYERLRIEAAEDPSMPDHVGGCASCQAFAAATQVMDRELPELWAPPVPSDFTSRVLSRARAERALGRKPWYRRWLDGEDTATVADAFRRAFAYGGLVGGLAGVMGGVAMYTRYCAAASYTVSEGGQRLEFYHGFFQPAVAVYQQILPLTMAAIVLVAVLLLGALRPVALMETRQRVSPGRVIWGGLAAFVVLLAVCGVQALGVLGPMGAPYWTIPAASEAIPFSVLLLGGWSIVLVVAFALMTRGVTGAPAQAGVFYGGALALFAIFSLWNHWSEASPTLEVPIDTAVVLASPLAVLGWAVVSFGLLAGGGAAWLVLVREGAPSRWAVAVLLAGGLVASAGCQWTRPPVPLTLTPGPRQPWTMLASPGGVLRQKTITLRKWDDPDNLRRVEAEAHRLVGPRRLQAVQLKMVLSRLSWDVAMMEQTVRDELPSEGGLGGFPVMWRNNLLAALPNGRGEAVARELRQQGPDSAEDNLSLTGRVLVDDRPAAGVGVHFHFINPEYGPPTWDMVLQEDEGELSRLDRELGEGDYSDPSRWWMPYSDRWGRTDAEGRFTVPGRGRFRLELVVPGGPLRRVENLPETVEAVGRGTHDVGVIHLWR